MREHRGMSMSQERELRQTNRKLGQLYSEEAVFVNNDLSGDREDRPRPFRHREDPTPLPSADHTLSGMHKSMAEDQPAAALSPFQSLAAYEILS